MHVRPVRSIFAFIAMTVAIPLAGAATAPAPQPGCRAPEARQFDFWVGDWTVKDPAGKLAGTNLVTHEYGNCVVQEHWHSSSPEQIGSSFSIFDRRSKRWHQTWVDNYGTLLLMDGGLQGRAMVLRGASRMRNGRATIERTTWTPLNDGRVHQLWDYSTDRGHHWTVRFDGFYSRR